MNLVMQSVNCLQGRSMTWRDELVSRKWRLRERPPHLEQRLLAPLALVPLSLFLICLPSPLRRSYSVPLTFYRQRIRSPDTLPSFSPIAVKRSDP